MFFGVRRRRFAPLNKLMKKLSTITGVELDPVQQVGVVRILKKNCLFNVGVLLVVVGSPHPNTSLYGSVIHP